MRSLRIGLCQATSAFSTDGTDPRPENLDRAVAFMRRAADQGARLTLLGEVFLNGYRSDEALRDFPTRVDPPDQHILLLIDVARELDLHVALGICRAGGGPFGPLHNSAVLLGPAGVIGWYDKVHVGTFPLFDGRCVTEGLFFVPGRAHRVFDTPVGRIGLQICRDVRFPEASRVLALKGAEVIVNLSAAVEVATESWEYFTRTRANENQVWFAMTSVVGRQKDFMLFGGSRLVSPTGKVVARTRDNEEDLIVTEIDLDEVARARAMSHVFDTRVPSAYAVIAEEADAVH
ncbi:MAG: carbon-nitrogen hydrolase family protein [Armatimonadetes bacterium]|nr:carbon-nitrogen hydrolase family protein [Armatimonadota bacterium]